MTEPLHSQIPRQNELLGNILVSSRKKSCFGISSPIVLNITCSGLFLQHQIAYRASLTSKQFHKGRVNVRSTKISSTEEDKF